VREALHQVRAAGLERTRDDIRVGVRKVRGRDRVQILVEQEANHRLALALTFPLGDETAQLLGREQIGVAQGAVIGVVLPRGCGEAPVLRLVRRRTGEGARPKVAPLPRRVQLHLHQVGRLHHQAAGEVSDRLRHRERVIGVRSAERLGHGGLQRLRGVSPRVSHTTLRSSRA
jgi:hypothetical protein